VILYDIAGPVIPAGLLYIV